jgi:hypothetical protein
LDVAQLRSRARERVAAPRKGHGRRGREAGPPGRTAAGAQGHKGAGPQGTGEPLGVRGAAARGAGRVGLQAAGASRGHRGARDGEHGARDGETGGAQGRRKGRGRRREIGRGEGSSPRGPNPAITVSKT